MNTTCEILKDAKTIAVVGISSKPDRTSRRIAEFLLDKGYTVVGVNPAIEMAGEIKVYPTLTDIPFDIDIVDVFRKPEDLPQIIPAVLEKKPKVLWLQLGIRNDEAVEPAIQAGITTVQDKCVKIEYNNCL